MQPECAVATTPCLPYNSPDGLRDTKTAVLNDDSVSCIYIGPCTEPNKSLSCYPVRNQGQIMENHDKDPHYFQQKKKVHHGSKIW